MLVCVNGTINAGTSLCGMPFSCVSITALLKRPRGMQEALVIVLYVCIGSVTMLIGSMAVTMYNTSN